MKSLKLSITAAAAMAAMVMGSKAKAAIVYQYVTPSTSYSVPLGGSVTVPVYLKEVLTGGSTSLIAADGGLLGAGFSVTQNTTAAGAAVITSVAGSVSSNGSNFAGGAFVAKASNTGSHVQASELEGPSATSGPDTDANGLLELGTVTITPTAVGTDSFTLANFTAPATTGGWTQTFGNGPSNGNGFDLDVSLTGGNAYTGASHAPESFTVSATSVPEPASIGLAAVAAVGLAARRRRRA